MNLFSPKPLLRFGRCNGLVLEPCCISKSARIMGLVRRVFLAPDVSALGYLVGLRTGAACYNAAHNYVLPLGIGAGCFLNGHMGALIWIAVWVAHIGFDRMLNYGLKYPTAFKDTHLGRV